MIHAIGIMTKHSDNWSGDSCSFCCINVRILWEQKVIQTMMANEAIGQTYAPLEVFLTAGIFYWAINLVIEFFGKWVGRRHAGYSRNLAA